MRFSPLVLVMGMDHKGTSLLSGVFQCLGLSLPSEFIAADQCNPAGYFEWAQIVEILQRLLIDLELWWPSAQGCLPLSSLWFEHPPDGSGQSFSFAELRELVEVEKGILLLEDHLFKTLSFLSSDHLNWGAMSVTGLKQMEAVWELVDDDAFSEGAVGVVSA